MISLVAKALKYGSPWVRAQCRLPVCRMSSARRWPLCVWQSEGTRLKSPSRPIARRASTWSSERCMKLWICVPGQAVAKATGNVALRVGNV